VIDELDEVDPSDALRILTDAAVVARSWRSSKVLLTSRPGVAPARYPLRRELIPTLSRDEVQALGRRLGVDWLLHDVPAAAADSCKLPLFAILVALARRRTTERIVNRAQLFELVLDGRTPDPGYSEALMTLAIECVNSGRSAPATSFGVEASRQLEATGMVTREDGWVRFGLPAFEQWYAGQALVSGRADLASITSSSDLMSRWRYPVAIAVAVADRARSDQLLAELSDLAPAVVPWVLHEAEENWDGAGVTSIADARSRLEASGRALLSPLLVRPGLSGIGLPPGFTYAWRSSVGDRWATVETGLRRPADAQWMDVQQCSSVVDDRNKVWPWSLWMTEVRSRHESALKDLALPCSEDAYVRELTWAFARATVDATGLRNEPIEVATIRTRVHQMLQALDDSLFTVVRLSRRSHLVVPPGGLASIVQHLEGLANDDEPLPRPWGEPDNLEGSSGWVEDCWSDDAWLRMTERITEAAIDLYSSLAETWFPHLKQELPTYVSMPVEISIRLEPDRRNGLRTWAQLWRPLAPGQSSVVKVTRDDGWSFDEVQSHWERWTELRGATAHRSRTEVNHYATPLSLTGDRPASVMAYKWLWRDLHRLHLAASNDPFER
jgi:hypothetical protein